MNFKKYWWLWLCDLLFLCIFVTFVVLKMDNQASTSLMATVAVGMTAALFSMQYRNQPSKIALWINKKGINLKKYSLYITLAGALLALTGIILSSLNFHLVALIVLVFGVYLMFEGYCTNGISGN